MKLYLVCVELSIIYFCYFCISQQTLNNYSTFLGYDASSLDTRIPNF